MQRSSDISELKKQLKQIQKTKEDDSENKDVDAFEGHNENR